MFVNWNNSSSNSYWNYNLERNWNIHEYSSLFMFLEFQESMVLFFPATLSLFSNPQHELVLPATPVTLIYKVLWRPTFTSIWLPSRLIHDPRLQAACPQGDYSGLSSINYQDYQPHRQCSNTHCQDTLSPNFVHISFNWLIGVTCKFWGTIVNTLSWLSDNKQRTL